MACKVVFTQAAERDRDRIIAYLLGISNNAKSAGKLLDALDSVIAHLSENPLMYEAVEETRLAARGYRRAFFLNYVALYHVENDTVELSRIFHQKQDYAKLL